MVNLFIHHICLRFAGCGMCANLLTLPLQLLDNSELEPQRCYIPDRDAGTFAGKWCKCVLQDDSYAICRVTSRAGSETCCFIDHVVASRNFSSNKQRLSCLEPLTHAGSVARISCIITITVELLQRPELSLQLLTDIVRIFLRHLKLINGCHVQHGRLLQLGVASIELHVKDLANCSYFELHPDTLLHIDDVRLVRPEALPRLQNYFTQGFEAPLSELEQLLSAQSKGFNINALLVGAVGSGKSSLLAEFLHRHPSNCFYITAAQMLHSQPGETERQLRNIFQAAHTFKQQLKPRLPIIILLEDLELFCPAAPVGQNASTALRISAQLYQLIDELRGGSGGILCLATTSAADAVHPHARRAGRFSQEVSIDAPTQQQRQQLFAALWQQEQQHEIQLKPELLSYLAQHTQGYAVGDLTLLLRQLQHKMLSQKTDDTLEDLLQQTLAQCQPSAARLSDVRLLKISTGFEAIGGMSALKRTLQVSVLAALQHSEAHKRFGLSLPRGVLLYGPPGCAKTSIAKSLAKEAQMTFVATSAAEVYSPYVGCAERFITQIFNTARKNAPCLIFLDEIDSLVGKRTIGLAGGGGNGSVQLRILSTLLTEMDGIVSTGASSNSHILVVAATNRPDMIDDALLRPGRFDKLIHVPAPDLDSRLALLRLHASRMPFHPAVQLEEIAARTERFSGADLCNLCNEAAIEAFQRNFNATQIELQDFNAVLARQKSSLTQSQIDSYYKFASKYL